MSPRIGRPRPTGRLTTVDRCDRCPAEGRVRTSIEALGAELVLCGHHYASNELALMTQGWVIVEDLRHELTAT